jgi:hypothetical protein
MYLTLNRAPIPRHRPSPLIWHEIHRWGPSEAVPPSSARASCCALRSSRPAAPKFLASFGSWAPPNRTTTATRRTIRVSDPRISASIIELSFLARCRGTTIAAVELGDLSTDDRHPTDRPRATEAPDGVGARRQLGVEPSDNVSARGSATPDHCVDVMASRRTNRSDVHLRPKAAFVSVKDEGTDVVTNVQDQCVRGPDRRPGPS